MKFPGGNIKTEELLQKGFFSFLCALLVVIILPVHVRYLPPFMILWGIFWISENYLRIAVVTRCRKSSKTLFILFISYYLWQAVGLTYSADIKMGLSNLFGRLSLVLFPLVLIYPGDTVKFKLKTLLRVFAFSTALYVLFCFGNAIFRSVSIQGSLWSFNPHPAEYIWLNYFYSSELTISEHPSYVAMYALLSSFICFESYFDYSVKFGRRLLWLILGLSMLVSQYFISSRAGILISLILIPLYFVIKFRQLGKMRYSWIWIILILVALVPLILKNQRVDYLYGRLVGNQDDYERKEDPRFVIWKSALEIASKNFLLGVGIGDVREELSARYLRIGEIQMAKEQFNAHNQFLEVLLENGIIGLVLFISIFVSMFYIGISDKNLLYIMFILMIFMFLLFETVLNRLAGVTFFSFFSMLLCYTDTNKEIPQIDLYKS
jgi:O-antigen ligase